MLRKLTIGRKLWLSFAVLLAICLISGVVLNAIISDVEEKLSDIQAVEDPARQAAYEMEINTIDTGRAVFRCLEGG